MLGEIFINMLYVMGIISVIYVIICLFLSFADLIKKRKTLRQLSNQIENDLTKMTEELKKLVEKKDK